MTSEKPLHRIAHVDMDAFFAAVEQLDHPAYRRRPVIVGGLGPRGVVATASYEARRHGVASAMPMSRARSLCPNGIYLEPRFDRYREISQMVREILLAYTPLVEFVSLDEAFLDLTESEGTLGPAPGIVAKIKDRIHDRTCLTCSIGLAPNRFLAKLASEMKKPDGLMVIEPGEVQALLDPLPVGRIWGVGKVTARRLEGLGLRTIFDLRRSPLELLVREFGISGKTLYHLARGEDDTPVRPSREAHSISREVTLPEDLYTHRAIEDHLQLLAHAVADELRDERLLGKMVRIKIRFADFQTATRQASLTAATDSSYLIEAMAVQLFRRRISLAGRGVRLIGVGVGRLSEARAQQLPLFDNEEPKRSSPPSHAHDGEGSLEESPQAKTDIPHSQT